MATTALEPTAGRANGRTRAEQVIIGVIGLLSAIVIIFGIMNLLGSYDSVPESVREFPTDAIPIPIGKWIDDGVDWLSTGWRYDASRTFSDDILLQFLVRIERFLLWIPWWSMMAVVGLAAWRIAGSEVALAALFGMLFIGLVGPGYWEEAMETLALMVVATLIALAFGIPLGIAAAKSDLANTIIRPILDAMQTMPSFVYLIPALMLFGLGKVPAVMATVIYAVPPAIRLTNLGIRLVDREVVEAARSFGTTSRQLLLKVQLPLALPNIMAGVNQTIMMALAMVIVASLVGAGGLGAEVLKGIARLEVGTGFEAGFSVVIMAVIIDRISQGLAKSRRVGARE